MSIKTDSERLRADWFYIFDGRRGQSAVTKIKSKNWKIINWKRYSTSFTVFSICHQSRGTSLDGRSIWQFWGSLPFIPYFFRAKRGLYYVVGLECVCLSKASISGKGVVGFSINFAITSIVFRRLSSKTGPIKAQEGKRKLLEFL